MSRPMNDDEVLSEMKKMVSFIKQEAMEKAREIQVKADEEFAIEKVEREACVLAKCLFGLLTANLSSFSISSRPR